MNELYIFKQEKIKYEEQIKIEENEFAKQKLTKEFQDKTKRYLGTAIGIINSNFNINYSMNKEAIGLTASFQKINSIVRKTDEEIFSEMKQLDEAKDALDIDPGTKETIGLAIDIVRIYCANTLQNTVNNSLNEVNVFENNKIDETRKEDSEIDDSDKINGEENNDSSKEIDEKEKIQKDSPFIPYKIALGLIIIPLTCYLILGVFLFAANAFSHTAMYGDIMSNEVYSKLYPKVYCGIIILLSAISASFISSLVKGRTNNKISFTVIPFALLLLLIAFSENIIELVKSFIQLENLPMFIKLFEYSYILITIYGFMLFFYLFAIFQKHIKINIIEIIDVLIIIYVGLLPGLDYILNIFDFYRFGKLISPLYDYPHTKVISIGLLIICIVSNLIYIVIKNKIIIKKEKNVSEN